MIIVEKAWASKISNDAGFRATAVLSTQKLYLKRSGQQNWEVTVDFVKPSFWSSSDATPEGHYLVDVMRVHERIGIDWCNLHRELPDGSGFSGYI